MSAAPLTIAINSGVDIAGLTAGATQYITPDGAASAIEVSTVANPNPALVVNSVGEADILGDLGAQVYVTFALPTFLFGSSGTSGSVSVSYNATSACAVDVGTGAVNYFDPRVGTRAFLDPSGGELIVELGGIFRVEPNSTPDVYVGDAVITVSYVANQ